MPELLHILHEDYAERQRRHSQDKTDHSRPASCWLLNSHERHGTTAHSHQGPVKERAHLTHRADTCADGLRE